MQLLSYISAIRLKNLPKRCYYYTVDSVASYVEQVWQTLAGFATEPVTVVTY